MMVVIIRPRMVQRKEIRFKKMTIFGGDKVSLRFVIFLLFVLVIVEITFFTPPINFQSQFSSDESALQIPTPDLDYHTKVELPDSVFSNGDWQSVHGTKYKFFVYSAYLDKRNERNPFVRIIATTKTKFYDRVSCLFYFENTWEFVSAKITLINEHWTLPYSAVFLTCFLKNASHIPFNVSVVAYDQRERAFFATTNRLLILNRDANQSETAEKNGRIALCIKPVHYEYNKVFQLVEFLELNRLLGVDHFVTYNKSMSRETSCIFDEYINEGVVSVHPWNMSLKSQIEIRTENLFAALNDCLYRNMFSYSYIMFIDLDEFIVPRVNSTIPDMLRWLNSRFNAARISSYSFQNAFFYLQWEDDAEMKNTNDIEKHLITLKKTKRRSKLNPHKQRSKFIVQPQNVVDVGNHFVWQFLHRQTQTLNVLPDVAILHHYRVCEFGGDDCIRLKSVVDDTLHRHRQLLTCKFAQKWRSLSSKCLLPFIDLSVVNGTC